MEYEFLFKNKLCKQPLNVTKRLLKNRLFFNSLCAYHYGLYLDLVNSLKMCFKWCEDRMKKRFLMMLALLGVSLAIVTCGEGSSVSAGSVYTASSEADFDMFTCDASEDGKLVFVESSNETVVCNYDEYLEDWAWIPTK